MFWAQKLIHESELSSILETFNQQAEKLDILEWVLLMGAEEERFLIQLWMALPDIELLSAHKGFESCMFPNPPCIPILLAGSKKIYKDILGCI